MGRASLILMAVIGLACAAKDGGDAGQAADAARAADARPVLGDGGLAPDAAADAPPGAPDAGSVTSCAAGQDLCDGICLPRTSTGNCHGGCTVCPRPANGLATCDGASCGVSCDPGNHPCGSQCLDDDAVASCGARCAPCPAPENGQAVCVGPEGGQTCDVACDDGFARCAGACVAESAAQCGASCAACDQPVPANATRACRHGACTFTCDPPYLRSGDGCFLATALAVGATFSCAQLTSRVRCWASDVTNLTSGVTAVSAGDDHGCAIVNGALRCWGDNGYGQLGDGNAGGSSPTAVAVTGLGSGVVQVSAGADHTCAVSTGGALRCWGRGLFGRLGNGGEASRSTPALIYPTGATQVAAGGAHTCALLTDGTVQCWGDDTMGQLGLPRDAATDCGTGLFDIPCKLTPTSVPGVSGVTSIYAGSAHTCAILAGGDLRCWGSNTRGQLGGENDTCSGGVNDYCPGPVHTASEVVAVSGAEQLTCYVQAGGRLRCMGYNDYGQVGLGFRGGAAAGTVFEDGVLAVSGGPTGYHVCAQLADDQIVCWGHNTYGQLGDGTTMDRYRPVPVLGD